MSDALTREEVKAIVDDAIRTTVKDVLDRALGDVLEPMMRDLAERIIAEREPHMEVRAVSMKPFVMPDINREALEGMKSEFIVPIHMQQGMEPKTREHPEGMIEWTLASEEADKWKAVYIFPDELEGESE